MKRNWKRILSLWLTVCMVFTMNFGLGATAVYASITNVTGVYNSTTEMVDVTVTGDVNDEAKVIVKKGDTNPSSTEGATLFQIPAEETTQTKPIDIPAEYYQSIGTGTESNALYVHYTTNNGSSWSHSAFDMPKRGLEQTDISATLNTETSEITVAQVNDQSKAVDVYFAVSLSNNYYSDKDLDSAAVGDKKVHLTSGTNTGVIDISEWKSDVAQDVYVTASLEKTGSEKICFKLDNKLSALATGGEATNVTTAYDKDAEEVKVTVADTKKIDYVISNPGEAKITEPDEITASFNGTDAGSKGVGKVNTDSCVKSIARTNGDQTVYVYYRISAENTDVDIAGPWKANEILIPGYKVTNETDNWTVKDNNDNDFRENVVSYDSETLTVKANANMVLTPKSDDAVDLKIDVATSAKATVSLNGRAMPKQIIFANKNSTGELKVLSGNRSSRIITKTKNGTYKMFGGDTDVAKAEALDVNNGGTEKSMAIVATETEKTGNALKTVITPGGTGGAHFKPAEGYVLIPETAGNIVAGSGQNVGMSMLKDSVDKETVFALNEDKELVRFVISNNAAVKSLALDKETNLCVSKATLEPEYISFNMLKNSLPAGKYNVYLLSGNSIADLDEYSGQNEIEIVAGKDTIIEFDGLKSNQAYNKFIISQNASFEGEMVTLGYIEEVDSLGVKTKAKDPSEFKVVQQGPLTIKLSTNEASVKAIVISGNDVSAQ